MFLKSWLAKDNIKKAMLVGIVIIFVILPFTTPITVFIGTKLNHFSLFKIWKEITMMIVLFLVLLSGTWKRLRNIKEHWFKVLVWAIAAYAFWTVALGLADVFVFHQVNWEAFIYAVIVDLRFLFFLILCWLVAQEGSFLKDHWQKLLLIPAVFVVIFGVLQHLLLPADFLKHLGYGKNTITPYQLVDQKPDYVRIQSTLRGPNPFGVYLILIIVASVVSLGRKWARQIPMMLASLISLFATYSRGAWLGVIASLGSLSYINITSVRIRKIILVTGLGAVLMVGASAYTARKDAFVQNTLLHTDSTSKSPESSNEGRSRAIKRSTKEVIAEPFGRGPGSAGPASLRNNKPERISENYYLQIGQELGWLGLTLFLAINVVTIMLLWQKKSQPLAKILLASFVGITIANMVSHAWTDDTIALLWWGLAGIAIAPGITKTKRLAHK